MQMINSLEKLISPQRFSFKKNTLNKFCIIYSDVKEDNSITVGKVLTCVGPSLTPILKIHRWWANVGPTTVV